MHSLWNFSLHILQHINRVPEDIQFDALHDFFETDSRRFLALTVLDDPGVSVLSSSNTGTEMFLSIDSVLGVAESVSAGALFKRFFVRIIS